MGKGTLPQIGAQHAEPAEHSGAAPCCPRCRYPWPGAPGVRRALPYAVYTHAVVCPACAFEVSAGSVVLMGEELERDIVQPRGVRRAAEYARSVMRWGVFPLVAALCGLVAADLMARANGWFAWLGGGMLALFVAYGALAWVLLFVHRVNAVVSTRHVAMGARSCTVLSNGRAVTVSARGFALCKVHAAAPIVAVFVRLAPQAPRPGTPPVLGRFCTDMDEPWCSPDASGDLVACDEFALYFALHGVCSGEHERADVVLQWAHDVVGALAPPCDATEPPSADPQAQSRGLLRGTIDRAATQPGALHVVGGIVSLALLVAACGWLAHALGMGLALVAAVPLIIVHLMWWVPPIVNRHRTTRRAPLAVEWHALPGALSILYFTPGRDGVSVVAAVVPRALLANVRVSIKARQARSGSESVVSVSAPGVLAGNTLVVACPPDAAAHQIRELLAAAGAREPVVAVA